ncbi:MAG: pyridoxamine 5'-phosphate oxidase [Candidatus Xiphinematobacter sp.]|nr:MAG: pyridoxamine 5'-phosphate oxidase [Candidatus Xiphinematobacter sp.]QQY09196.1 MAG: pyridoxamine 5'-phosphate oxidase [Candidatus Xiphinematobacter sp.]QQY09948.1 MAG: pyridoxamine 5'-phosphate oxidase [Candidatus Xiphinematobacter sp.]QQY10938.1 MAG: pyridoxamine 5'-phosphate oxidase [Candidatus Xiphinematobacter sp.]QQY11424.1 MAG: pyridoxamine 5'-phosphate oxidase [Candidatus Xiphinematobacter sp.]
MKEKSFTDERKDYRLGRLRKKDLPPDPIDQFFLWLNEAFVARITEPTAMSLATVDLDGSPLLRTVLLKRVDQRGFIFFTNLKSRKASQLQKNATAALLFPWLLLERQVIITGKAQPLSPAEASEYFLSRPRKSQLSTWASPQSQIVPSRMFLEREWEAIESKFREREIPVPPFWGGFCVTPKTIEFWQGGQHRLHDRLQYRKDTRNVWVIDRLAP